jgi:hypothetical protein
MQATTKCCATLVALAFASCGGGDDNREHADAQLPDAFVPADSPADSPVDAGVDAGAAARTFVYIESNDPQANAVIAFERQSDGTLVPLATTSKFPTGGTGVSAGRNQRIGPLDSDKQLALSPDARFVFAVNSGGSSVAAFQTAATGELTPVVGSPFPSNGANPVSIAIAGSTMQVVNKAVAGTVAPNYASLTVREGTLRRLPATASLPIGASPSIALITTDRHLLFGTEFFDGSRTPPVGQIDVFMRGDNGALTPAPGSPFALPPDTTTPAVPAVALNAITHPRANALYVGFPTRNQLGVYTYNSNTGAISFVTAVPSSGQGIGWFLINAGGTRLYAVNSTSASISVFDLANPLAPVETSSLLLKDASGSPFVDANGVTQTITSQPFQLAFDPDQTHIYVISQRVTTNTSDLTGNFLHVLEIAADGTLAENTDPIDLRNAGVAPGARPQGVLVFSPR